MTAGRNVNELRVARVGGYYEGYTFSTLTFLVCHGVRLSALQHQAVGALRLLSRLQQSVECRVESAVVCAYAGNLKYFVMLRHT